MSADAPTMKKLVFSPSPHVHNGDGTSLVMYTFIAALLPAIVFSFTVFGWHSARVFALAGASAMTWEWGVQKLFRVPVTVSDGSALLTGLLLAAMLPASVPWWVVIVGTGIAIIVGKQLFGGLGSNPFCPALVGWAVLSISWGYHISFELTVIEFDIPYSILYPLAILKHYGAHASNIFSMQDLALGRQAGGLATASPLLLLCGGLFLLIRGVISWRIPMGFIAGVLVTTGLFWVVSPEATASPLFHLLTGNLMLGIFFLATDYPSSPVEFVPQLLFGLGCGALTILFRVWSLDDDGVVFAILLMNVANPLLDKIRPRVPALVGREVTP